MQFLRFFHSLFNSFMPLFKERWLGKFFQMLNKPVFFYPNCLLQECRTKHSQQCSRSSTKPTHFFISHFNLFYLPFDTILLQFTTTDRENKNKKINPLHPNISMHILHTVLHTFLKVLKRRICFTVKSSWLLIISLILMT